MQQRLTRQYNCNIKLQVFIFMWKLCNSNNRKYFSNEKCQQLLVLPAKNLCDNAVYDEKLDLCQV